VDAVIKSAAADNPGNKVQLSTWLREWRDRALIALDPVVARAFGSDGPAQLGEAVAQFNARFTKAGLAP
jgi:phenol/toluene 2-monooxygenase (NADH) P1/A1